MSQKEFARPHRDMQAGGPREFLKAKQLRILSFAAVEL